MFKAFQKSIKSRGEKSESSFLRIALRDTAQPGCHSLINVVTEEKQNSVSPKYYKTSCPKRNDRSPESHYKYMGIFGRSRAANSTVSGPIWLKFEFIEDMHVLITCKF